MKLVFPVRFAEGERVVQTTADEISEGGAYVISTTPPEVGAGVTLSLYLPDAAEPVNASGVVRTVEQGEPRPGFGVDFTGLGDDGLLRIRKVLQLAQSTGAPNLRAFQRTPVELIALIITPKGTVETRIRDISPAGMFIEMEKMPAFAAVFPVLVPLPDGEPGRGGRAVRRRDGRIPDAPRRLPPPGHTALNQRLCTRANSSCGSRLAKYRFSPHSQLPLRTSPRLGAPVQGGG